METERYSCMLVIEHSICSPTVIQDINLLITVTAQYIEDELNEVRKMLM